MNQPVNRNWSVSFPFIIGVLLWGIALGAAGLAQAQDLEINNPSLEWTPIGINNWMGSYNYGNLVMGESKTATFDLLSAGPSPLWVYVVGLNGIPDDAGAISPYDGNYTLGAFSFDPTDNIWNYIPFPGWPPRVGLPQEMPVGNHILIDVIFKPTSLADYSAYLYIASNDSVDGPGSQAFIHLEGTGVDAAVPEPATLFLFGLGLAGLAGLRMRFKR